MDSFTKFAAIDKHLSYKTMEHIIQVCISLFQIVHLLISIFIEFLFPMQTEPLQISMLRILHQIKFLT